MMSPPYRNRKVSIVGESSDMARYREGRYVLPYRASGNGVPDIYRLKEYNSDTRNPQHDRDTWGVIRIGSPVRPVSPAGRGIPEWYLWTVFGTSLFAFVVFVATVTAAFTR